MDTGNTAVADMMSGLMMVFLFVAVAFMLNQQGVTQEAQRQRDRAEELNQEIERQNAAMRAIAELAEKSREQINAELNQAFAADFARWDAELLQDNTVRFKAPEVLFQSGRADLTRDYRVILDAFFPRYVAILYRHREDIEAVRIEGHTSSDWQDSLDLSERFLRNMELSQARALATLNYCYPLVRNPERSAWLRGALVGNGRSFGRLIRDARGREDGLASRRVEFKVVTRAESRLYQILDQARGAPGGAVVSSQAPAPWGSSGFQAENGGNG